MDWPTCRSRILLACSFRTGGWWSWGSTLPCTAGMRHWSYTEYSPVYAPSNSSTHLHSSRNQCHTAGMLSDWGSRCNWGGWLCTCSTGWHSGTCRTRKTSTPRRSYIAHSPPLWTSISGTGSMPPSSIRPGSSCISNLSYSTCTRIWARSKAGNCCCSNSRPIGN